MPLDFGEVLETIVFLQNPKTIVEFGILEGYSLTKFLNSSNASIKAYDIFDDFNGNGANRQDIEAKFREHKNVTIEYGDFYKTKIDKVDLIHIDIANNGDTYRYALENYLPKLTENGIMVLEGGSKERDQVEWMIKYGKPPINPVIKEYSEKGYDIKVVGKMPSLTIVKNLNKQ